MGLSLRTRVEKSIDGVEIAVSPVKKMFQVQWSVKKVMLTVSRDIKRLIVIDFLKKTLTVKSSSCCQLFSQTSAYLLNDPHILG